jgi:hypothetical protein
MASIIQTTGIWSAARRAMSWQLMGKAPDFVLLTKFHARISDVIPNALAPGILFDGVGRMPLSGAAYDPDTLAMLYRALDAALHRAVPDFFVLNEASQQDIRQKLARALIRAYEHGERDPELLATIAARSYRRGL